jgi:hypothetical protein
MPHSPISYPGGPLAEAGDIVTYHQERSTVEAVIVGDRVSEWGVEEPGLMLQNVSFGRVFVPVSGFDEDLSYVSRGA